MKKTVAFALVLLLIFMVCGCNEQLPNNNNNHQQSQPETTPEPQEFVFVKPETNLEFWLTENVGDADFSQYQEQYGWFGCHVYYGTGYVPTIDEEDGRQINPGHCVLYTVSAYPDYSDGGRYITEILITDPNVTFGGISLNSTFEEFETLIEQMGFEITETYENSRTARRDKYWVSFSKDEIRIAVQVENREGIIF